MVDWFKQLEEEMDKAPPVAAVLPLPSGAVKRRRLVGAEDESQTPPVPKAKAPGAKADAVAKTTADPANAKAGVAAAKVGSETEKAGSAGTPSAKIKAMQEATKKMAIARQEASRQIAIAKQAATKEVLQNAQKKPAPPISKAPPPPISKSRTPVPSSAADRGRGGAQAKACLQPFLLACLSDRWPYVFF